MREHQNLLNASLLRTPVASSGSLCARWGLFDMYGVQAARDRTQIVPSRRTKLGAFGAGIREENPRRARYSETTVKMNIITTYGASYPRRCAFPLRIRARTPLSARIHMQIPTRWPARPLQRASAALSGRQLFHLVTLYV